MDMQTNERSADAPGMRRELARLLAGCLPTVEQWCLQADTERWGLSAARFTGELARCAESRFRVGLPSVAELQTYLSTLHLEDLALACACADGVAEAWEYFVGTYRGYLRASAGAMLKRSASSPEAQELADSLFAELYGLSMEKRGSLLRYFHGRSTLKTWLRAVLAQRHVDKIRAGRKFEELSEDGNDGVALRGATTPVLPAAADPHRARYLAMFTGALQTALNNLPKQDAERLRMYYAEEKKLAEIGRALGEHESSVSRHLEKARRDLRHTVEEILRAGSSGSGAMKGETKTLDSLDGSGEIEKTAPLKNARMRHPRDGVLSEAEIALCFEYAAEDTPIDLGTLFSQRGARGTRRDTKDI